MKVLWDLFEITVNFFQGFIMVYFEYYYLGDKRGYKFLKSSGVLFGIGLAILISLLNSYMMFESLFTLFYIVIMFVYALLFLNGNFIRKTFASVFPMVISLVSSAFVSNFAALLFRTNLYNIISQNNIDRFVTVTAVQLMIIYLVMISLRTLKKMIKILLRL